MFVLLFLNYEEKRQGNKNKDKKLNLLVMGSICSSADVHVRDSLITEELGEREEEAGRRGR